MAPVALHRRHLVLMETQDDLFRRLDQLNDIGASLSDERNLERLLEKIVLAAKQITHADGGTLYLSRKTGASCISKSSAPIRWASPSAGSSDQPTSGKFPDLPLYREDGSANDSMVAVTRP
jgi:GAF domain-containing protein